MKVLTTSGSSQTFKIIPREYATSISVDIVDDSTNTTKNYAGITSSISVNHLQVPITFNPVLKEGRFYDLIVKKTDDTIIYKDKIFCTDQAINQIQDQEYTVNSAEYTSDTTYDNDFIII